MAFWAYILKCSDSSYYTGHTDNLEVRLAQHTASDTPCYTNKRRPLSLVWSEVFPTREEALACELQVKSWSRAKKEALIRGDWDAVRFFARPPARRFSVSAGEAVHPSTGLGTNGTLSDGDRPERPKH